MPRIAIALGCSLLALFAATANAATRTTAPPPNPRYKPVPDRVYQQEVGNQIFTPTAVTDVAVWQGNVFVVAGAKELCRVEDGKLASLEQAPARTARLIALGDQLWAIAGDGLYRLTDSNGAAKKMLGGAVVDVCLHNGLVHAATRDTIYRLDGETFVDIKPKDGWLTSDTTMQMEDGSQVLAEPVEIGPIERIASYSGTLYLLGHGHLRLLDGAMYVTSPADWGTLPSRNVRAMCSHGSRLMFATDRGLATLRGAAFTTTTGKHSLPYEDVTCIAPGFADDLWIGTTAGAIRNVGSRYHFFGASHWLPGERVNAVATDDAQRSVYIATDRGLGIIHYEPYTLKKKAAFFEQQVEAGGHKRLGFVHEIYRGGDADRQWLREISDNDGGHTAHYLAAMTFKYAVTKDEAARREAVDAFQAMRWLQTITGTDGFFARAIWAEGVDEGERSTQGSGGLPAKWVPTKDGKWSWKGDTSSDEVNAHYYAVALFHDLAAQGDEQTQAAEHLARISKHIIDNGWVLRDVDGKPTRWGRWDPNYLQRPYGSDSRGLNSLEAQTYMWTAIGLTGKPEFRKALDQLLTWRYDTYTVREKITFPPENVVTWDDELAFHCFHPLLTYCDEPRLRSIYLRALARHWEVMRMQKIPFFNFIYGGLTGNDCDAEPAVQHLREWSLDTIAHHFHNSHRADLAPEPGYPPYVGDKRALSPRELACTWGSRSAIEHDGGSGRTATPPVGWLEDYWMGRYYGMIAAPLASDPRLVDVPPQAIAPWGAKPYNGPPRPTK